MSVKEFNSKESMITNWNKVIIAVVKALSGECNIIYDKNEDGKVNGLTAEILLQFEVPLSNNDLIDYDTILKDALKEVEDLDLDKNEVTSKQRVLIDSIILRNSIIKAESGELKINLHKNDAAGGLIVGLTADLNIHFPEPLEMVEL